MNSYRTAAVLSSRGDSVLSDSQTLMLDELLMRLQTDWDPTIVQHHNQNRRAAVLSGLALSLFAQRSWAAEQTSEKTPRIGEASVCSHSNTALLQKNIEDSRRFYPHFDPRSI